MIKINVNGNAVFMEAEGKLNDKDYDKMLPLLKDKIKEHGDINWYFEMENFKGWTPHAFWRDIKFGINYQEYFKKIAIVGENKWQELMTDAVKPFTSADIKYYDENQAEEAKKWVAN